MSDIVHLNRLGAGKRRLRLPQMIISFRHILNLSPTTDHQQPPANPANAKPTRWQVGANVRLASRRLVGWSLISAPLREKRAYLLHTKVPESSCNSQIRGPVEAVNQ